MNGVQYFGEYRSVMTQQNGCTSSFVSSGRDQVDFAPQIIRACGPCSKKGMKNGGAHAFRLARTLTVSTKKQQQQAEDHYTRLGIPFGVDL